MGFLEFFYVASMPVLKVLLLTALGLFLSLDRIGITREITRKELNKVVFYVFNPALVGSSLAKTITIKSFAFLWYMPLNILLAFIIGSALGWILIKITRPPQQLKGLILGCCSAGNYGNLPFIIIPAICKEKGSPFGEPDVCQKYGMTYASLSMAVGAIFLWSYVYNVVRIYSSNVSNEDNGDDSKGNAKGSEEAPKLPQGSYYSEPLLPSKECHVSVDSEDDCTMSEEFVEFVSISDKIRQSLSMVSRKLNLKAVFSPSTTGVIAGFVIGLVPQIRKLMIGASAPLHVIEDSASLLGDAAIPTVALIMGGNLLRGLKGSGTRVSFIVGILAVRYVIMPVLGIFIVKSAIHFGLVHSDPLYQFFLLLQFALPPAVNIGTITQLFKAGESECSVILFWAYALASVSLTLWSTLFIWLVI